MSLSIGVWALWWMLWLAGWNGWSTLVLLLGIVPAGAGWHHYRWHLCAADDLGRVARETASPVCVEAVVLSSPCLLPAVATDPLATFAACERTRFRVRVSRVREGAAWRRASGISLVTIRGALRDVLVGDRVRLSAVLRGARRSLNPGEFDAALQSRASGQRCLLECSGAGCVEVLERPRFWSARQLRSAVRGEAVRLLDEHLRPEQAGLAAAILLGARERIGQQRSNEFLATGTIHLLAISGLHVGTLAYGFWMMARMGLLSRRNTLIAAAVFAILYALLTEGRPPVVRASILIVALCAARYSGRRIWSLNTLAAAGLVVLAVNPASLFQAGTQLSFLAVATLARCAPLWAPAPSPDPLERLIRRTRPWPWRLARRCLSAAVQLWLATAVVWLVALPLVAYHFHVVTPIALIVNPLVWLPMAVALFSGFGVLVLGRVVPPAAWVCGGLCDASLSILQGCVHLAHGVAGSHFWTAGPALWWLAGFYLTLAGAAVLDGSRRCRWLGRSGFLAWTLLGLCTAWGTGPLVPRAAQPPLTCTFLAVGHGTCVVIELPDGTTWMYDAGALGMPATSARLIFGFLCNRGITHLDAVILSHADADHYNALPELLDRVTVDAVYVPPAMFEQSMPALRQLETAILRGQIQVHEVWRGRQIAACAGVAADVLHPPRVKVPGSDNANSIVLSVCYRERRILLPGDLESPGLEQVLAGPPLACDIVMAPHHGSAGSDPAGLAKWADPAVVVVSSGRRHDLSTARRAFEGAGCRVLHTADEGAVQVTIGDDRRLGVRCWRREPW